MVGAIILAAGSSSRLGQPKQLLTINGETLLARVIRIINASEADYTIVVLGSNYQTNKLALQGQQVGTVYNAEWSTGIGSSIRVGVDYAISHHEKTSNLIIATCDQVTLTSEHVNNLIQKRFHSGASIVASEYDNTLGIPVLFNRRHFEELCSLKPEQGAKSLIMKHQTDTLSVPFEGGSIDIDTMEDYINLVKNSLPKDSK